MHSLDVLDLKFYYLLDQLELLGVSLATILLVLPR